MTLDTLQTEKRSAILELAQKHGARNVRVFGSFICGENGSASDVDFLVNLDIGRNIFDLGERNPPVLRQWHPASPARLWPLPYALPSSATRRTSAICSGLPRISLKRCPSDGAKVDQS